MFSFLWQGSLLTHLKGDKKPTKAYSSSCELYNSSPSECHVWLPDSGEHYRTRVQLPSKKEQFSLGWQRIKYNCCVILLDLLRMAELSNWIWIRRGLMDSCPVFLTAAPGRGRWISLLQDKRYYSLFFSSICLLIMVIFFFQPQNQRVFYKNSWEGQSKEGNKIWFSFLFFFQLLA